MSLPIRSSGNRTSFARHLEQPDDAVIQFGAALRALRRRWLLVVASILITAGVAWLYTILATPMYQAAAAIRIDSKKGNLPSVITTEPTGDEVLTDLEEIRSREMAAEVVDSLGLRLQIIAPKGASRSQLLTDVRVAPSAVAGRYTFRRGRNGAFAITAPGGGRSPTAVEVERVFDGYGLSFRLTSAAQAIPLIVLRVNNEDVAATNVLASLQIERAGAQTNVINMRYRNSDPVLARDVLNAWTATFVGNRQRVLTTEARSTAAFLRTQLDTMSSELSSSENTLRSFRETAQVVSPQVDADAQVTRLTNLQAQRSQVEGERSALSQAFSKAAAASLTQRPDQPSPYRSLLGFPTLLRNPVASELLRSLSDAETQRFTLLSRRTMADPDVQLQSDHIREIEAQIRALTTTYLQGLSDQLASIDTTLAEFGSQLNAIPAKQTEFARLQRTPEVLAQLVTTLQTRLKEAQIAEAVEDPSVRVIDPAVLPIVPVSPRPSIDVGLGLFLGLILGIIAALFLDRSSHTVQSRSDLRWATGLPVLALIPRLQTRHTASIGTAVSKRSRLQSLSSPGPIDRSISNRIALDSFTRLHVNLGVSISASAKTLVFTSALPGDGKTTSAANYAIVLARLGKAVLLVDADLRRGMIDTLFNVPRIPGLSDVLHGDDIHSAIHAADINALGTLSYVTSGTPDQNPGTLLGSERMGHVLAQFCKNFDVVVIDSPPLNVVADAAMLAAIVDGVIVVARAGVTPPDALRVAMEQLRHINAPIAGTILTDIDPRHDETYGKAYAYYGADLQYTSAFR